ncbi:MAG: hypothetical protein K2X95_05615 [Flavobacteriaceae bacterium]|nr:hypothetical protein [Flavobacteriaceae bacterium]
MNTNQFKIKSFKGDYSTELAIGTFAIGTVLFALYYLFPNKTELLMIGIFYILFAFLINGIMLLYLLYCPIVLPNLREYITIKILILVSNIPIAILYLYIIISLFNTENQF